MADNKVYLTAGLPVAKNTGQTPSGNSVYITSGLPPEVETAVAAAKLRMLTGVGK